MESSISHAVERIYTTLNKVLNLLKTEFSNSDQLVYTLGLGYKIIG